MQFCFTQYLGHLSTFCLFIKLIYFAPDGFMSQYLKLSVVFRNDFIVTYLPVVFFVVGE